MPLILKPDSTFESYSPPRFSKAKRYITMRYKKEHEIICKNCHQPLGLHKAFDNTCPQTYILQYIK